MPRVLGLLLAAQRAAGLMMQAEQPELFLPSPPPSLADPDCPFYERCGEDCLGSPLMRKQMSPEVKARLESLPGKGTVEVAFSLLSDFSPDIAMACKYGFSAHIFDPRPLAPRHLEQVQLSVNTMETPHPFMAPEHEPCETGCASYWEVVAHSKVSSDHFIHHPVAVGPPGGNITMHENRGGNYQLDHRKGMQGGQNVTVPTVSVLDALRAANISKVDVVRIDYDGLEETILMQVASLPEEMRPEVIFCQIPSFHEWVCKGEREECRVWKKNAHATVRKVQDLGYTFQLYHKMDFIFMKPQQ